MPSSTWWCHWHYSPQMGQSPRFLTWSLKVLHYTSVSDLLGNVDSLIQSGISAVSNFVFLSLWVASWKFCWPGTKAGDSTSAWPCVIQMVPHCDPQDPSVTGCFGNVITNLLERDWYRANTLWSRLDVNVTTCILTYTILTQLKSYRMGKAVVVRKPKFWDDRRKPYLCLLWAESKKQGYS